MVSSSNTKLGKLLRESRKAVGLSQAQAADIFGVERQTVGAWERGKNGPQRERAQLVADTYKIDVAKIDPLARPVKLVDTVNLELHKIPIIRLETTILKKLGDTREVEKAFRGVGKSMLAVTDAFKQCFAVSVSDNAMSPDYKLGDICIVDPNIEPEEDDTVVASFPGEALILRRYHVRGKDSAGKIAFDLVSPNADYRTLTANASNPADILGVVIEFRRPIRRAQ